MKNLLLWSEVIGNSPVSASRLGPDLVGKIIFKCLTKSDDNDREKGKGQKLLRKNLSYCNTAKNEKPAAVV